MIQRKDSSVKPNGIRCETLTPFAGLTLFGEFLRTIGLDREFGRLYYIIPRPGARGDSESGHTRSKEPSRPNPLSTHRGIWEGPNACFPAEIAPYSHVEDVGGQHGCLCFRTCRAGDPGA